MCRLRKIGCFSSLLFCISFATKASPASDTLRQRMAQSYVTVTQNDPEVLRRIDYIVRNTDGTDVVIRELPEGANDSLTAVWLDTFAADSTWHDIDYQSRQRGAWPPAFHVQRISQIARSYKTPASPYYHSAQARQILHRALNKWFDMGLQCPNWWYNEIGGPRLLSPALLLLDDELTADERDMAVNYMKQARIGMTGQNRTWLAGNVLVRGLLERNDSLVQAARDVIVAEVSIAAEGKEGIQPDYSFHQHGPQQQFGNYGLAYVSGIASWGKLFQGTRYALTPEQTRVLRGLVVEGMSRIIWKGMMDVSSCGRQLFPNTQEGKTLAFGKVLLDMAVLDPEYAARYHALYDELIRGRETAGESGYTHFRYSDMSVYRQPRWMATLKMSSRRTVGSEVVNGENLLSDQMADGVLLLYKTGREYLNIAPVWDYTELPGITTAVDSDTCWHNGGYQEFRGNTDYAGGLVSQDSACGVSAMIFERDGVRARKAWFFSPDYIICRGDSITGRSYRGIKPVRTTVAQQLAETPVRVTDNKGVTYVFRCGEPVVLPAKRWPVLVQHAGVGYWFPDDATARQVEVSLGPVTGNWRRFATMYDTTAVTENIFSVTIGHGMEPMNAAYTYVIVPEMDRVDVRQLLQGKVPFRVPDEGVAVEWPETGRKEAVFFEAGRAVFSDGTELEVSAPAIAAVEADGTVSVADPTCQGGPIRINVGRRGKGLKALILDADETRGGTLRGKPE
ncbi:MAG: hypothetical protein LIO68_06940 [Rikenellaceae bacterium]|nr:hypothetical protein [Rikenellaceae bacterium]